MSRRRETPGAIAAEVVALRQNLAGRHRAGRVWQVVFLGATVLSVLFLAALLYNVVNQSFGLVAAQSKVDPETLAVAGVPLEKLDKEQLLQVLRDNLTAGRPPSP
jgi:phosphate transport system permease protein